MGQPEEVRNMDVQEKREISWQTKQDIDWLVRDIEIYMRLDPDFYSGENFIVNLEDVYEYGHKLADAIIKKIENENQTRRT